MPAAASNDDDQHHYHFVVVVVIVVAALRLLLLMLLERLATNQQTNFYSLLTTSNVRLAAADDREAAGEAAASRLLLPEASRAGHGGPGVPAMARAGLRQPPVEGGVPAARVLRAARVQSGHPAGPHRAALRGHAALHRAAQRADHGPRAARAVQQVPGAACHDLGLLQRNAAARLQRPQQLPVQPAQPEHLSE